MEPRGLPTLKIERDSELAGKRWEKGKITLGICVMEKKALSAPMTAILDRLRAFGEFEIIMFGDKVILEDPVEKWPPCDALIAFHSKGFPLEKAKAYAALRKPFLVNALDRQFLLHDRRKVYQTLEERDLPTPKHAIVNRDFPNQDLDHFVEDEDYIQVYGQRIYKPFVEKPVDGEDHSVMIYYPSSAGGGMKALFRKIGNRSSEFHPDVRRVRREGSYIYEEFMPTGGTDVKVYTVGPDYAHAEARKSPVVDGVVMRSADGKEIRYPVLLTPIEKEMARTVTEAFGQAVCGFDLLRSHGKSYVCDVNGWSFVKNSHKYYDDAACVLRGLLITACAPHMYSPLPPKLPWAGPEDSHSPGVSRQTSIHNSTFGQKEELRCVIAVIRHGDRTPKQKVKLKVTQDRLLALMLKYNGNRPRAEAKLKSAVQLQDLLDALRMLVPKTRVGKDSDSEAEDYENAEKLRHVKAVLEEGGHFSGIYRKAQLKPQKWAVVHKEEGEEGEVERPTEALMVLKYGGVLTHAGRKQAEELGRWFRFNMYPEEAGEGTGLIRLHSTYRHDLKIYSSDEGRVQMSAAAFTKGLLDLEGPLTPILVSLVSKDSPMLDGLDTASIEMEQAKRRLYQLMTSAEPAPITPPPEDQPWMVDGGGLPPEPLAKMRHLVDLVKTVTAQVKDRCKEEEEEMHAGGVGGVQNEEIPPYDTARALGKARLDVDKIAAGLPCGSENFLLMFARWKKLERDIYNERKDRFDISKIPDIYDSAKYDLLHNEHLGLKHLDELFGVAKDLADGVIPNEYGINPHQKLIIGTKIARRLLGKVAIDLHNTVEDCRRAVEAAGMKKSKPKLEPHPEESGSSRSTPRLARHNSRGSATSEREDEEDAKETPYRLDPLYANVRTPQRHVRTRLYFTSESHIHSMMNVLRYGYLDECLQGEAGLVAKASLRRLFECKELDYLTHIVVCMYENVEVDFSDPKHFRIELLYSPGAAYSPLEVSPKERDHTLPVMEPELLQDEKTLLTFERMQKMLSPFAMPAEDFPPPALPQSFSGLFTKTNVLERIANMWPFRNRTEKSSQESTGTIGKDSASSGSKPASNADAHSGTPKSRNQKEHTSKSER